MLLWNVRLRLYLLHANLGLLPYPPKLSRHRLLRILWVHMSTFSRPILDLTLLLMIFCQLLPSSSKTPPSWTSSTLDRARATTKFATGWADSRESCCWKYVDQSKLKIGGLDFVTRVSRRCEDVASRKSVPRKSLASGLWSGSSPRLVLVMFHAVCGWVPDGVRILSQPMHDP